MSTSTFPDQIETGCPILDLAGKVSAGKTLDRPGILISDAEENLYNEMLSEGAGDPESEE